MSDINYINALDRPIAYHRVFVDIAGSVAGAVFLSQLVYWHRRVEGKRFYKSMQEWAEETGLTRYEQEAARKALTKRGLLHVERKGVPARLYFQLDEAALNQAICQFVESSKQHCGPPDPSLLNPANKSAESSKPVCCDTTNLFAVPQQTITEITTETTTQGITAKGPSPDGDRPTRAEPDRSHEQKIQSEPPYPPSFEEVWRHYPKRAGNNPKKAAYRAWQARCKAGVAAETLFDGVIRYAQYCQATGDTGTRYVMRASTFFGPDEPYTQTWEIRGDGQGRPKPPPGRARRQAELEAHNAAVAAAWAPPELRPGASQAQDSPLSRNMRIALDWVPPELREGVKAKTAER